ncbi:uncharacterized protein N7469_000761 [Penicillium citrinum]|uniref:Large ribosomal subunit protein mL50 n=2 Tax=Penicillium TaxID=5073 RepID=A0A9W9PDC7_PENCI|nr:uncharacterized protein N7469_000761 [Penicillium citrinum]KAJ5242434.1 hypothetical protein N7469_000761 [Penicillium citrinum]KAJ5600064.1 hypothetical protein N7450_001131 [Penicillium hetheringtonii]
MRPVTRLPLREALYVCSSCRQDALPRVSPLARQFQHQTRRYASDSPSFLERTRSKLWNTEKPPGAADPYTGESQLAQKPTATDGELAGGDKSELAQGDNYVQAENWKGLASVGYLPEDEWIQQGRSKSDKYQRFGEQTRTRPILPAAHQAAVEICLLHLLGKPLTSICQVNRHNTQIREMIESCTVQPSATQGWEIKFPDGKTHEALVFVFNQIGGQGDAKIESGDFVKRDRNAEVQPYRSLSLVDPEFKFAYVKRLSQLYHRRISDKAITSSNTIGELIVAMSANLKEKPKNVTKCLSSALNAGLLPPNLAFHSSRISKADRDEDYGRKKVIYSEYIQRGLAVPHTRVKKRAPKTSPQA